MEPTQNYPDNIQNFIEKVLPKEQIDRVKNTYGPEGYALFSAFLMAFGSVVKLPQNQRDDQIAKYLADAVQKKTLKFDSKTFPTFTYNGKKLIVLALEPESEENLVLPVHFNGPANVKLDPLASEIITASSLIHGKFTKRNEFGDLPPSYDTRQREHFTEDKNFRFVTRDLSGHIISATRDTRRELENRSPVKRILKRIRLNK